MGKVVTNSRLKPRQLSASAGADGEAITLRLRTSPVQYGGRGWALRWGGRRLGRMHLFAMPTRTSRMSGTRWRLGPPSLVLANAGRLPVPNAVPGHSQTVPGCVRCGRNCGRQYRLDPSRSLASLWWNLRGKVTVDCLRPWTVARASDRSNPTLAERTTVGAQPTERIGI